MEEFRVVDRIFRDRDDVEHVLSKLLDQMHEYGFVSVANYYTMVGLADMVSLEACKYGWRDSLEIAEIVSANLGYQIRFPKPEPLDFSEKLTPIPEEVSNKLETKLDDLRQYFQRSRKTNLNDPVNHPQHYQSKNGLEVINVIEAFTDDLTGMEAVCTGNALKYICRWKHKNGVQDLKKAVWYMNHLIDILEKENSNEQ